MEALLTSHFSMVFFLEMLVLFGGIYFLLRSPQSKLGSLMLPDRIERWLRIWTSKALVFYEPLALIILGGVFVLVYPLLHGLFVLFAVLVTLPHIRNYATGRMMRIDKTLAVSKNIMINNQQGTISELAAFGVYIMMNEGMHYFTYDQLNKQGYVITAGSDFGEYCTLNVQIPEAENSDRSRQHLLYLLMSAPYIDTSYPPQFLDHLSKDRRVAIKLLLHRGNYHRQLSELVNEWGYQCQLSN